MEYRAALGYKKGKDSNYFFGKSKKTQEQGADVAVWSELTSGNFNFNGSTLEFNAFSGYPKLRLSLKMAKKIEKQGGDSKDSRAINILFKSHGKLKDVVDALKLSIYCDEKDGLTNIYSDISSAKKVKEIDTSSGTLAMDADNEIHLEQESESIETDDILDVDLSNDKEKDKKKKKKKAKDDNDPFIDDFFNSDEGFKDEADDLLEDIDVDFKEEDDDFWN